MILNFVRDKTEVSWCADYGGIERAIGLFYSPALGAGAILMLRTPLSVPENKEDQFSSLLFARGPSAKFWFTPTGFTIEVDEEQLRACIQTTPNNPFSEGEKVVVIPIDGIDLRHGTVDQVDGKDVRVCCSDDKYVTNT